MPATITHNDITISQTFKNMSVTMKKILIVALVLLQTAAVSAQQQTEAYIKKILSVPGVETLGKNDSQADLSDVTVSYCKFVEFTMPSKKKSLLENMERAVIADQSKAYSVYVRKPGSNSNGQRKQAYDYGANNEYSVTLGTYPSHNYYGMCFADPNDSIRRHAYCFVWFKDGGNYHCYYYHIYGVKPSEFAAYKECRQKKSPGRVRTSSYSDGTVVITQTYDSDGNVVSMTTAPQQSAVDVKTDIDFMLQFGNLRAAFLDAIKDADAKTLQTGIVVKIVRLCKEKGKILSANEKRTCIDSIADMYSVLRKTNDDSFMAGMLQEARIVLSK